MFRPSDSRTPFSSACVLLAAFLQLAFSGFLPALDLSRTHVEKLPNGLTVMVLEDNTMPLVSTQVLYKVGGRNECAGATGLAHFVEHMAFRATKNFPDTDVVSRIYAAGGEWHGYTWIDQTTYFETVPARQLDLVLQIQADRMSAIVNNPDEVEAERGAVITELHSYENDPASVLYDAVLATAFQQHPYRYNVIGWLSDVERITHADLEAFYRRFYNPSNAVLAVAGNVTAAAVLERAKQYFGAIPPGKAAEPPRTVEPPQNGERRLVLHGTGPYHYFQITYQAPSARDPDYAAFLVLQSLLTGSGGVNFEQRGSGETARAGSRLHGIAPGIASFFQPTADPYAIDFTGHIEVESSPTALEEAIETQLRRLRSESVGAEELDAARRQVRTELVFDVETTENAAHQMAYFEGIGAFDVLLKLPDLVRAVTAEDVRRVASKYLEPQRRTVGWYLTDRKSSGMPHPAARAQAKHAGSPSVGATVHKLRNGITAVLRPVPRTPTGFLRIVVPSNTVEIPSASAADTPAAGYTSIEFRFLKEDFERTLQQAAALWKTPFTAAETDASGKEDPETRLDLEIRDVLGISSRSAGNTPVVVSLAGDFEERRGGEMLQQYFGHMPRTVPRETPALPAPKERERVVKIPGKPQSQFGYVVPAPGPSHADWYAYRILLYVMSHGYEGRLGKDLISRRGLIYYIDSAYRTDGRNGWILMTAGVDAGRLETTRARFLELLAQLKENPPTQEEVAEAKQHLIGRRLTGFQSNEELTERDTLEWILYGRLITQAEFEQNVNAVALEKVRSIVPAFLNGVTVTIDTR